ncbi:MAG: hypothetical protein HGA99_01360 [Chlorobiaceae bacterium]|nr:hypothetical protein [Chlorobiaceae bacterium]
MVETIIIDIRLAIVFGTIIPKPAAKAPFLVKGWGIRREEQALIYKIPNHKKPEKPYEKGITVSEFEKAYQEIQRTGFFTRKWFDRTLSKCSQEGGCNFTTIGGIFQLLGIATYSKRGVYTILPQKS